MHQIFHGVKDAYACDHVLPQSADYFARSVLSHPLHRPIESPIPPTRHIFALYVQLHYPSVLSPTEGAFWAGP